MDLFGLLSEDGRGIVDDSRAGDWSGGSHGHGAEADVDGVGKEVRHAGGEDNTVG